MGHASSASSGAALACPGTVHRSPSDHHGRGRGGGPGQPQFRRAGAPGGGPVAAGAKWGAGVQAERCDGHSSAAQVLERPCSAACKPAVVPEQCSQSSQRCVQAWRRCGARQATASRRPRSGRCLQRRSGACRMQPRCCRPRCVEGMNPRMYGVWWFGLQCGIACDA